MVIDVTRALRRLIAITVVVISVIISYTILTGIREVNISPLSLLLSSIIILTGWFLSAIRLLYIVNNTRSGRGGSIFTYLEARFIGDVLAKITPSSIGGEPARAYIISSRIGMSFTEAYAVTIYEVYFDVILTCVIGAFISLFYLPLSIPVFSASMVTGLLWFTIFNSIDKLNLDCGRQSRYLVKLCSIPIAKRFINYLVDFRNHYLTIRSMCTVKNRAITWFLTMVIHTTWAFSIIPLVIHEYGSFDPGSSVLAAFSSYYLMQAISILPTPGGSGVSEYALSIVLKPRIVVAYRLLSYFLPLSIGIFSIAKNNWSSSRRTISGGRDST